MPLPTIAATVTGIPGGSGTDREPAPWFAIVVVVVAAAGCSFVKDAGDEPRASSCILPANAEDRACAVAAELSGATTTKGDVVGGCWLGGRSSDPSGIVGGSSSLLLLLMFGCGFCKSDCTGCRSLHCRIRSSPMRKRIKRLSRLGVSFSFVPSSNRTRRWLLRLRKKPNRPWSLRRSRRWLWDNRPTYSLRCCGVSPGTM
mmetsp:Transcript_13326/g.29665  ORF Transcript_13326/g.29665 Transcript_13326/m.29665 type:complete len:201 (-) Transcript_13326:225-827(-)